MFNICKNCFKRRCCAVFSDYAVDDWGRCKYFIPVKKNHIEKFEETSSSLAYGRVVNESLYDAGIRRIFPGERF